MDNRTGYLSITDGNSVYLGTAIRALGITTPVIDFRLNGFFLILTYTASDGTIQNKSVDLTTFVTGGSLVSLDTATVSTTIVGGAISSSVKISSIAGNSITSQIDGIWAPSFVETPLTATDSSTVDLTASGSENHTLVADVKISADSGNQIFIHGDGLYVSDATTYLIAGSNITITGSGSSGSPYVIAASVSANTPLQVSDSATLHLVASGTFGHSLTGNVKVSTLSNNAIIINSDGLYVSAPSIGGSYTDAQARAAISALSPLIYSSVTGVMSISAASSLANGYLTNTDWNAFNSKITTGTDISSGSATPIYAGQSGSVLQFYGLRAGANVSISLSGNDIVIASTGGGGGGTSSTVFTIDFIVGDGQPTTPANGAAAYNPAGSPLIGKTVLGFFIEGIKIAGVPRSAGEVYFTFNSVDGSITLSNGTFVTDTYYSILYK